MRNFLLFVIIAAVIGGGLFYYVNYYQKPAPEPAVTTTPPTTTTPGEQKTGIMSAAVVTDAISEAGFVIDDKLAKYTFASTTGGDTVTLSAEALATIKGQEITSYLMPISPANKDAFIFTTIEEATSVGAGLKNHVYQFNPKTNKLTEVFWEKVTSRDGKDVYRSVGVSGSKLLIIAVDPDYETATCHNVWYDFARDMKALELSDIGAGLQPYMVPDPKTAEAKTAIEQCLQAAAQKP
jgi:hypothetical protein